MMDTGIVVGVVGGVIGALGGMAGTYFSIKNTAGPRERSFMIQVAVVGWLMITLFLIGLFLLPQPFNCLLWVPYGIALPLCILWCNRRQRAIRAEEAGLTRR